MIGGASGGIGFDSEGGVGRRVGTTGGVNVTGGAEAGSGVFSVAGIVGGDCNLVGGGISTREGTTTGGGICTCGKDLETGMG
jgi:hypothetical protein